MDFKIKICTWKECDEPANWIHEHGFIFCDEHKETSISSDMELEEHEFEHFDFDAKKIVRLEKELSETKGNLKSCQKALGVSQKELSTTKARLDKAVEWAQDFYILGMDFIHTETRKKYNEFLKTPKENKQ